MDTKLVKDLMVPLSEYATVSQDATLSEAVFALKQAQANYDQAKYRHRAVLVYDDNNRIVGKINFLSVLQGLEPKYDDMLSDKSPSHLGFTRTFQKTMIDQLKLWQDPLEKICEKAAQLTVKSFMTVPKADEKISATTTIEEAIHYLVLGHHQSLLVTEKDEVIGLLRLTDVVELVVDIIMACEI